MDKSIRCLITILTEKEEEFQVMEYIHNQLVGNQDYIDNNIILNDTPTRQEDLNFGKIELYIFQECTNAPNIKIGNFKHIEGNREIEIKRHRNKDNELFNHMLNLQKVTPSVSLSENYKDNCKTIVLSFNAAIEVLIPKEYI